MVFALLDGVTKYIKKKDINEDNFACKLVYRGTVALLFVAAGLIVGNSLFGQPINRLSSHPTNVRRKAKITDFHISGGG